MIRSNIIPELRAQHFREQLGYARVREADNPIEKRSLVEVGAGSVTVDRLEWLADPRGALVEVARVSDVGDIAQVYVSATSPGVVKGWHLHARQTDRFFVLRGRILLATCDLLAPSHEIRELVVDAERSPLRVTIHPGVAHGWMALGSDESWVLNLVSREYDGTDEFRRAAHEGPSPIKPYDWQQKRDG